MIDVVYQYVDGPNQMNELKYSLRSLDLYLPRPFKVWIIGDKPSWLKNVNHIPHERNAGVYLTNCYDATSKLKMALDHPKIGNNILWMYDDMYLLKDCKESDFETYLAVNHFNELNHTSSGVHKELIINTLKELESNGKPMWNCETHTPRLYSKQLLQEVWDIYSPRDNRLLFSTLYYNHVFHEITPHKMEKPDRFKAGFYGSNDAYSYKSDDVAEIEKILSGKTYLNHNNRGLSVSLRKVIETRFPDTCQFEVST